MHARIFAALAAAAALTAIPAPAAAAANPPVIDSTATCNSTTGSCSLTVSGTGDRVALFVSSDAVDNHAQTVTVKEGHTAWGTKQTSISFQSPNFADGYTGIWASAPLTSGTHTLTIAQGQIIGSIYAWAEVFSGSSGFQGAASADAISAAPAVSLTATATNAWDWCVTHDWTSAAVPAARAGFTDVTDFEDVRFGDSGGLFAAGNSSGPLYTTANPETDTCGASNMSGDEDTVSGIVVLGS